MARIEDKKIITQTLNPTNKPIPRFYESDFRDTIIRQGYEVLHERALKCPCKGRNSENLSTCLNCGSSGWIYINPTKTRMVVQSMSLNPKYESWGVYGAEVSSITALPEDKLSYMDKITVLGAISEHSEVLHTTTWENTDEIYAYTIYDILDIYFIGIFISDSEKIFRLTNQQYSVINGNKIIILAENMPEELKNLESYSFTIRYNHNPAYYIQEMVRDTMLVRITTGRGFEEQVEMPIHARAKRIDLFKDRENYTGNRLLDNSFKVCK